MTCNNCNLCSFSDPSCIWGSGNHKAQVMVVNSYASGHDEEMEAAVTLVHGKVGVQTDHRQQILQPDEQYKQLCSLGYNVEEKSKLLKPNFAEDVSQHITKYFNERSGDELSKTFYSDVKLVLEGNFISSSNISRTCDCASSPSGVFGV